MSASSPATSRPRVYLLHGLLGTSYGHFGAQIGAWQQDAEVVPIDLPGHGRCRLDAAEDGYLDEAAEYVLTLFRRFGPGRVVAASYLGAPLAVRCARAEPELVTSLVLTGFVPGLDRQLFLDLLAGFPRLAAESPEVAQEYDRLHTSRWRATLDAYSRHAERAYDSVIAVAPAVLAGLAQSVLLVNGSHKSIERLAAHTAGRIGPRVRGHVVDGAGHLPAQDAPEAVNAVVEQFWREREAGSPVDPAPLRVALTELLREPDPHRTLDSLESVVVLTHLKNNGLVTASAAPEDRPTTIEGWVTWAARRSLDS